VGHCRCYILAYKIIIRRDLNIFFSGSLDFHGPLFFSDTINGNYEFMISNNFSEVKLRNGGFDNNQH
jgi:hypothetical protein